MDHVPAELKSGNKDKIKARPNPLFHSRQYLLVLTGIDGIYCFSFDEVLSIMSTFWPPLL